MGYKAVYLLLVSSAVTRYPVLGSVGLILAGSRGSYSSTIKAGTPWEKPRQWLREEGRVLWWVLCWEGAAAAGLLLTPVGNLLT